MIDKLPYELTKGVTATREGLYLAPSWSGIIEMYCATDEDESWVIPDEAIVTAEGNALWPWTDAAERLRYREGEPWCVDSERDNGLICDTTTPAYHGTPSYLHRLAAILCDDAEAFRVLWWCVTNLGGQG